MTITATRPGMRAVARATRTRVAIYLRLSVADREAELSGEDDTMSAGIKRQRLDSIAEARRRAGIPADAVVRLHTDHDATLADVVLYVEDGESAWKRRKVWITDPYGERRETKRVLRPVFGQMMRDMRAGLFTHGVCYNPDRLVRDPYDVEEVIETATVYGVRWMAATGSLDLTTDDGCAMLRIVGAMNNHQSGATSRRVARQARQAAIEGKPHWPVRPFGHNRDGSLVEHEAEVIRYLADQILNHGWTLTRCAEYLDEKGIRTTTGGTWAGNRSRTHGTGIPVGAMFRQARLAGLREYKGEILGKSNYIAEILPERRWRAVVAKLDSRAALTRGGSGGAKRGALLTGQASPARCEVCGGPLTTTNVNLLADAARRAQRRAEKAAEKAAATGLDRDRRAADQAAQRAANAARLAEREGVDERHYKCVNNHVSIREDVLNREIVDRMMRAGVELGVSVVLPTNDRPDTSKDERRLAEIDEELPIWRQALISRTAFGSPVSPATVVPTISALEIERDAIVERIKAADAGAGESGDLELDGWEDMDLDEQREVVSRAYASIVVLRRYDDQEHDGHRVITTFRETFAPTLTRPIKGHRFGTIKSGPGGWEYAE